MTVDSKKYYSGTYEAGFEISRFNPDGLNETWWVKGAKDFHDQYMELASKQNIPYKCIKVKIKVRASEKGRHGHLGAYDREVEVLEFKDFKIER